MSPFKKKRIHFRVYGFAFRLECPGSLEFVRGAVALNLRRVSLPFGDCRIEALGFRV